MMSRTGLSFLRIVSSVPSLYSVHFAVANKDLVHRYLNLTLTPKKTGAAGNHRMRSHKRLITMCLEPSATPAPYTGF